jgi:hypothetical protein
MKRISDWGIVLCIALLLAPHLLAADKATDAFENKKTAHQNGLEEGKAALIKAFDKKIALVGKQKGLSAEERLKIAAELKVEGDEFKKTGGIPFSPEMRDAAMAYLSRINRTAMPLAREYEKQINLAVKENRQADAKNLIGQKDDLAMVVGTWDCFGTNFRMGQKFTWVLYSDFTVNRKNNAKGALPKGWSFLPQGGMWIKNFAPGAPAGGFDDSCIISRDGQLFEAKNQKGGVYTGRLQ